MLNVIVTDPPRADLDQVAKLAEYGVATVHEAIGRTGYLGPAVRPNQQGTRVVRGLVMAAGLRDTQELREMDFPAWTAHVSAQGTVKETPGSVNVPVTIGGQLIRPGDAIVADDDGVCVVPRLDVDKAVTASAARVAKEDKNRKQLADGALGVDMYNLRPKLEKVERISYAEYVKRAGEGS